MQNKTLSIDELLTLLELCQLLKIKKEWVYQRIHAGTLPFSYCKVGAFLRFPASSVQKFIESQIRGGAA